MDSIGSDADIASLQADLMVFDAEVSTFLQQHHG